MHVLALAGRPTDPVMDYGSVAAASAQVAGGEGEARVHVVVFAPGGSIGPHEAGFGQLFVPLVGTGWIAGGDGIAVAIGPGEAGFVGRGEVHSKGSDAGMTALMVQVRELAPVAGDRSAP